MSARTAPLTKPRAAPAARRRHEAGLGYLLIAPTLLLILVLVAFPLAQAVYLSFTETTFIKPDLTFVGLKNFGIMVGTSVFWQVLRNSIAWTVFVVVFQFLIGLGVALLFNQRFVGRSVARALIILPWVTPGVIAALDWRMMFDPNIGIINWVLYAVGAPNPQFAWLANHSTALFAVIVSAIWKGSPFSVVMYLAALQGVSSEQLEAARVDGANAWQRLRHVILPEIAPVIRVTLLLTTVWTFNYFELIYVMTNGGPGNSTHIFPTYIYFLGFNQFKLGLAASYGLVSMLIMLIFTLLYLRELNRSRVLDDTEEAR